MTLVGTLFAKNRMNGLIHSQPANEPAHSRVTRSFPFLSSHLRTLWYDQVIRKVIGQSPTITIMHVLNNQLEGFTLKSPKLAKVGRRKHPSTLFGSLRQLILHPYHSACQTFL